MGGSALLFGSASHRLSASADGSLVLELRGTIAGLVTIVPVVGRFNLWYKWSRHEPELGGRLSRETAHQRHSPKHICRSPGGITYMVDKGESVVETTMDR